MTFRTRTHDVSERLTARLSARERYFNAHERDRWRTLLRQTDPTNPLRFYVTLLRASLPLSIILVLAAFPHAFADEPSVMRQLVGAYLAMNATALLMCTAPPLFFVWLLLRALVRPKISMAASINKMGVHVGGATALGFLYGIAVGGISIATSMREGAPPRLDVMTVALTASAVGAFLGIVWTLVIQIVDVVVEVPTPLTAPFLVGVSVWTVMNFATDSGLTPSAVLHTLFRGEGPALRNALSRDLPRPLSNTEWAEVSAAWTHSLPANWLVGIATVFVVAATVRRVVELERPRWARASASPDSAPAVTPDTEP